MRKVMEVKTKTKTNKPCLRLANCLFGEVNCEKKVKN